MAKIVVKKKRTRASPLPKRRVAQPSEIGKLIRLMGSTLGSAGGAMVGAPSAGGVVGSSLAGALSKWLGAGDYTVGSNTVVQRNLSASRSIPSMHNDSQSIIVRHKEYLGEVKSSISYAVQQTYPLNPGIQQTFPWLSGIASRFQEYTIRGAVFHYIPSSGSAVSSTNAALGTVMLQTSYRATDVPPTSKVEMLNEYCSNEVVPSDTMAHPIECDPKENPFNVQYVRTSAIPAGESTLLYDLGQTHLAVSGCQTDGNTIGDLWVTYEVELRKPLVASNVTTSVYSGFGQAISPSLPSNVFGTTIATCTGSLPATLLGQTIVFPKGYVGKYLVTAYVGGNTLSVFHAGGPTAIGCKIVPIDPSFPQYANLSGGNLVTLAYAVEITDPAVSPQLTYNWSGSGTLTSSRLLISEL